MGHMSFFDDLIESKLLNLHTAYIAKVLSYSGGTAKIQPLNMVKAYGKTARKQSPLTSVPVLNGARYKLSTKTITYKNGSDNTASTTVLVPRELQAGDIVVCLCADRDISETRHGNFAVPPVGHHDMSSSVIVGIL